MTSHPDSPLEQPSGRQPRHNAGWSLRLTPGGLVILLAANLTVLSLLAWPLVQTRLSAATWISPSPIATSSPGLENEAGSAGTITASPTSAPPTPTASPTQEQNVGTGLRPASTFPDSPLGKGTLFLAINEGGYHHLFAYQPLATPFTRLTAGAWDDITPAISPDQAHLAFASNRTGHWDLYLLTLESGEITRLTDTPEYEAAPSWSPDGRYLVFETYLENNLEIVLRAVSGDQTLIPLSTHPAADFSPAWSPSGRQVAFVSMRSGEREVWLAELDKVGEERFTNLSRTPSAGESHPVWSPDGSSLAWSSVEEGVHNLYVWTPGVQPRTVGSGDWPAWSPDGTMLLTTLLDPGQTFLAALHLQENLLALPPVALPGTVSGLAWADARLPNALPDPLNQAASVTPTPLWLPALSPAPNVPGGRQHLVRLEGVEAPYALLHDLVDESFRALRDRVAAEAGWDLLSSLENAYVPLTAPLSPGLGGDWLYTGRAFAFNPLPVNAGWLVVVPEMFGTQTYWRIYLRARFQDGSQGTPLYDQPWDFNARYSGDPRLYEQGGTLAQTIPPGYWIDFTRLAVAYGWERLPALPTWRSFYPETRLNEFVLADGQGWRAAMLELYPPEVLITPTVIIPPTLTPTPTSRWYRTPTPTLTPTAVPTLTPLIPTAGITPISVP